MPDHRLGQVHELLVAPPEVFLAVVGAGHRVSATIRASGPAGRQLDLAGPPAVGTLDPIENSRDQFVEGNFERNRGVEFDVPDRQPLVEEFRLRHAPWKSIENPTTGLTGQPLGKDRAHQFIGQIFTAGEDRLGRLAKRGSCSDVFAEQCSGAEVAEAKAFRQSPPLGSLAGCRWP